MSADIDEEGEVIAKWLINNPQVAGYINTPIAGVISMEDVAIQSRIKRAFQK